MVIDYARVIEKANGYKPAISRFLRDMIALPSESCQEKGVVERIKQEMEKVGFDRVEIDPMGNVLGYIGTRQAPHRHGRPHRHRGRGQQGKLEVRSLRGLRRR